jgi:hypothetical protein
VAIKRNDFWDKERVTYLLENFQGTKPFVLMQYFHRPWVDIRAAYEYYSRIDQMTDHVRYEGGIKITVLKPAHCCEGSKITALRKMNK